MKKAAILTLTIVLTAALFAGCGCTNRNAGATSAPTTTPTATKMPTVTTEAATQPTTEHTTVPSTQETVDHGNGPLDTTTNPTNATTDRATDDGLEGTAQGRSVNPGNVG